MGLCGINIESLKMQDEIPTKIGEIVIVNGRPGKIVCKHITRSESEEKLTGLYVDQDNEVKLYLLNDIKMPEPQEYEVEIQRTSHGYVKIKARSKEQAEKVIRNMHKTRLMTFYKERFVFLNFGEIKEV